MSKSSSEISNMIDEKEKEVDSTLEPLFVIEQEILEISKQIIVLQGKKKDLEIAKSKGTHNAKIKERELGALKRAYWIAQKSGL